MDKLGAYTVIISSPKGGVGKTNLTLSLAWAGVNHFNTSTYVIHSDNKAPVITDEARGHTQLDCRFAGCEINDNDGKQFDKLKKYWNNIIELSPEDKRSITFIDSGGNKPRLTKFLSGYADLILIPVMMDSEAFERAIEHYNDIMSLNPDANIELVFIGAEGPEQLKKQSKRNFDIWDLGVPEEMKPKFNWFKKCDPSLEFKTHDNMKREGWKTPTTPATKWAKEMFRFVLDKLPED